MFQASILNKHVSVSMIRFVPLQRNLWFNRFEQLVLFKLKVKPAFVLFKTDSHHVNTKSISFLRYVENVL